MNWVSIALILGLAGSLHGRPENIDFGERLSAEARTVEEVTSHQHLSARLEVEMPSSGPQKRLLSPIPIAAQRLDTAQESKAIDSSESPMLLISTSPTSSPASPSSTTTTTFTSTASVATRKHDPQPVSEAPKARYNSRLHLRRRRLTPINSSSRINPSSSAVNNTQALVAGKSEKSSSSRQLFPVISLPPNSAPPQPLFNAPYAPQANPAGLNRQYLYSVNTIVGTQSPSETWNIPTPPTIAAQYRPPDVQQYISQPGQATLLLSPQQIFTSNVVQTHTETSIQPPQIYNVANVESTFHSQPNGGRPVYQQAPSLFHGPPRPNVTRLYSIIASTTTTQDPYRNYLKVQTRPTVTRRKVIPLRVTTARPASSTSFPKFTVTIVKKDEGPKKPNGSATAKPNAGKKDQKKGPQSDKKKTDKDQDKKDETKQDKNKKPDNKNPKKPDAANSAKKTNQEKQNNDKSKKQNTDGGASINNKLKLTQCKVSANQSDFRNENVCGAGDLKIIIKFDGDALNETQESLKQAPGTNLTAPSAADPLKQTADADVDYQDYDDANYPDDAESLRGPQANKRRRQRLRRRRQRIRNRRRRYRNRRKRTRVRQRRRKNRRKNKKDKDKGGRPGGGGGSSEETNNYQTIVLQPHANMSTTMKPVVVTHMGEADRLPSSSKYDWLMKFISYMPLLALLKPISFGFWTVALSPFLVIGAATVALGVVLYPWFTLSKEHAAHTAIKRPPTVVIHKHPRSRSSYPAVPITVRYAPPKYSRPTFSRRRKANTSSGEERADYPFSRSFQSKPKRRRKRHANLFTTKYTYRDINFRHWLLIKNNFEIRHLKWTEEDADEYRR